MTGGNDFLAGKDEAYRRAWIEVVETIRSAMAHSPLSSSDPIPVPVAAPIKPAIPYFLIASA